MKKEAMNVYGSMEKSYSLTLTYENVKRTAGGTTTAKVEKEARLSYGCRPKDMNPEFWANILAFQNDAEKILRLARKLMKKEIHVVLEFSVSVYENTEKHKEWTQFGEHETTINQVSFNLWKFDSREQYNTDPCGMVDNAEDGEGGGVYLSPDTRYTRENSDIWVTWSDGFIKSLAESGYEHEY